MIADTYYLGYNPYKQLVGIYDDFDKCNRAINYSRHIVELTNQETAAYENARDCIYFGYGRSYWNSCGLEGEEATRIWKMAHNDLVNEC